MVFPFLTIPNILPDKAYWAKECGDRFNSVSCELEVAPPVLWVQHLLDHGNVIICTLLSICDKTIEALRMHEGDLLNNLNFLMVFVYSKLAKATMTSCQLLQSGHSPFLLLIFLMSNILYNVQ
jgi:hypothetical protein